MGQQPLARQLEQCLARSPRVTMQVCWAAQAIHIGEEPRARVARQLLPLV